SHNPPRAEDLGQHPKRSAVGVGRQHHAVPGRQRAKHRVRRREARGERDRELSPLETREDRLERRSRGIVASSVVGELNDADGLLGVGRREVDRHVDGTGLQVRLLSGVDSTGGEVHDSPFNFEAFSVLERKPRTSEAVMTPRGRPSARTNNAGVVARRRVTDSSGSPTPIVARIGPMTASIGRSSIVGSLNPNSMRSSSIAVPTTSLAANGSSSVTAMTTWETPRSRIRSVTSRTLRSVVAKIRSVAFAPFTSRMSPAVGPLAVVKKPKPRIQSSLKIFEMYTRP